MDKFISQTELFLGEFSSKVIGITGTKGKSTTTSMLYEVLAACSGKKVLLVGNIGIPCLDLYDEIDEDTIVVFEMSCHQLAFSRVSPHVALFLNLYEEHLDYYGTVERYFDAKAHIAMNQTENDYFFVGDNVPAIKTKARTQVISYDCAMHFDMLLHGEHNQFNAQFVYKIATEVYGCDGDQVVEAICAYKGLAHRLEYVGKVNEVDYYDDSISTIPEAAIAALHSIPNARTVLIGGMDRHINYDILIAYIREHAEYNYIMMYASGKRIFDQVAGPDYCYYKEDLEGAVALAKEITPAGTACILSPAAASYGYFKNFEERGDVYKQLVLAENKKKTTIAFTGDIGFDHYMSNKWEDDTFIDPAILTYLNEADHVVANIEGPLVANPTALMQCAETRLLHTINPASTKVFRDINADIWNICNNHIMDAGAEGVECTLAEAKKFGAKTIGAGMNIDEASIPLILDEAGGIGLFGVGYQRGCKPAGEDKAGVVSWSDMDRIQKIITAIKAKCRWCVVVAHGGEEFTSLPSPYTRDRYHAYLEMGADLVVSHHPHVPMNYELVGDKAIFYSLGNFIFDTNYQRAQFNTELGLVLKLHFTEEAYAFDVMGIRIDRDHGKIVKGDIPRIFEDVQEDEYDKLKVLAAKMFLAATKRQQLFMYPDEFKDATEEDWERHFLDPKRRGRVVGEGLDFQIIYPLAQTDDHDSWKESKLKDLVDYILEQM